MTTTAESHTQAFGRNADQGPSVNSEITINCGIWIEETAKREQDLQLCSKITDDYAARWSEAYQELMKHVSSRAENMAEDDNVTKWERIAADFAAKWAASEFITAECAVKWAAARKSAAEWTLKWAASSKPEMVPSNHVAK